MKQLAIATAIMLSSCVVTTKSPTHQRFCIVVDEVKFKCGKAAIRPKCQYPHIHNESCHKRMYWYRYPTPNIHSGDTVDVSLNDRIQPTF